MSSKENFELKNIISQNIQQKEIIIEEEIKPSNNKNWIEKLKSYKNNKKLDFQFNFNLEGLGTIEFAKLHRDANRPLKKIKDFDDSIIFCPCCSLPKEKNGYIEEFKFNENTDEFIQCGTGIPLYFSFFRFSLFILIFLSITIFLPTFILTNYYTSELIDICRKIYENEGNNININYPECSNFIGIEGISKYFINGSGWALRFNGINLKYYRMLYNRTSNDIKNKKTIIIDYSFLYFLCLITLYILNLSYLILIYNINKRNDMLMTTPADYTIMISNLYSTFVIFLKRLKKINRFILNNKIERNKYTNKFKINEFDEISKDKNIILNNYHLNLKQINELGLEEFPQDNEINILEGFKTFITNRICVSTNGKKFNVSQINICYKIKELKEIEDKIQDNKSKILKILNDPKQQIKNEQLNLKDNDRKYFHYLISINGINVCQLEKYKSIKLSDLKEGESNLQYKINNLLEQSRDLTEENFSGVIFVTFNSKKDKEIFLKPYPKNFIIFLLISFINLRYYFCGCFINKRKRKRFFLKRNMAIEAAPEPDEIQYENLETTSYERFIRALSIYFISIVIIGISLICIWRLNIVQKKWKEDSSHGLLVKYGLSLTITAVISIINEIFKICLEKLTKMENHITMTNYYLSFSIKLTLFTFITSSIIPLITNYINKNEDYDLLVTNMLIMFLSNSLVTPIMWTLNIKYFLKKLIQFIIERRKFHFYTQRELNNLYELPEMKISYKYSYLAKTLLMSFLYIPIFPLGIIISLLGFILGYYLEKYNFIKMYKRPEMLNSNLCEFYSNYFVVNFFMLGIGNYIFIRDNTGDKKWALVNINTFGLLIIIPFSQILSFDLIGIKESQLKNTKNYEEEYFNFYNDYERSNPMTKKEGMKNFIFKLKEKGYINIIDEAIYKSINNINLMEIYHKSKKNNNNSLIQRGFDSKKEKKEEYKNILKKFFDGEGVKKFIFQKSIVKNEEDIEFSESDTYDNKIVNSINIKNISRNYFNNNKELKENNNNLNLESINIRINNNNDTIISNNNNDNDINIITNFKKQKRYLKNIEKLQYNTSLKPNNDNDNDNDNEMDVKKTFEGKNNEKFEENNNIKNQQNKIFNKSNNPFHFIEHDKFGGDIYNIFEKKSHHKDNQEKK